MDNTLLAKRLKELRKLNNYNQEYVASFLNLSRQAYSHYETGRNTPTPDALLKLAQLYSVPSKDLFYLLPFSNTFSDSQTASPDADLLEDFLTYFSSAEIQEKYKYLDRNEKLLIYFFQKISSDDQTDILDFLKIKAKRHLS